MSLITLLVIAVGLSMDAFAVALSDGIIICNIDMKKNLKIAAAFGIFQGLMPLIGYTVASTFAGKIETLDHWIAFVLLGFTGGKMIFEAIKNGNKTVLNQSDPTAWSNIFIMAIATSIDALAIGISVAVMPKTGMLASPNGHLWAFLIIAVLTFFISFVGVMIGCKFGNKFGKKAEIIGGIILIGIGVKILLEHTVLA